MGSTDDGRRVVFVGDARMMHRIEAALRDGQPITATVPTWAVLAATLPNPEEDVSMTTETGQGLAEYGLILALVAMVAIVALIFLGNQVSQLLSVVGNSV